MFSGEVKTEETEGNYSLHLCSAFQPGGSQISSHREEIQTSPAASTHSFAQKRSAVLTQRTESIHQYYTGNLTGQLCVELLWHIFVFSLKSSSSPIRLPTSILLNTHSSCTCGRTLVSYINLLFLSILTSLLNEAIQKPKGEVQAGVSPGRASVTIGELEVLQNHEALWSSTLTSPDLN